MKKLFLTLIALMLIMSMAGCGDTGQTTDSNQQNESGENKGAVSNAGQEAEESSIQVASDDAQMQTDDPASSDLASDITTVSGSENTAVSEGVDAVSSNDENEILLKFF